MARQKPTGRFRRFLFLVVIVGVIFLLLASFRAGPAPTILHESDLPGIGKRTTVAVRVEEPKRGLSNLRVEFVQGDRITSLEERSYVPLEPWRFWGDRRRSDELTVVVGSETLKGLEEGPAAVRVTAERAGSWLRSPSPAVSELPLTVKLRPPSVQVLSSATYVTQGGCEAVVYRVGASAVRHGVRVGDWWFPGYPMPAGDEQFALFGVPFDFEDVEGVRLIAEDDVGNVATATFVDRFNYRPYQSDRIRLSDSFMARVVPAIMSQTPGIEDRGDLLQNYLAINGELREKNTAELIELSRGGAPEFLWRGPFLQMPNAQVMSDFADRRSYVYQGEVVDQQDHLGFDLASTRMAEIPSANDGVVVLARYFGIYGNAVVVDHGHGLMSLYGHLSSLAVEEGQRVERGQSLGRSGATGLAGGDHLHFTMLLQGLSVNPMEWWDGHWIRDRLALKLGAALPFEE